MKPKPLRFSQPRPYRVDVIKLLTVAFMNGLQSVAISCCPCFFQPPFMHLHYPIPWVSGRTLPRSWIRCM